MQKGGSGRSSTKFLDSFNAFKHSESSGKSLRFTSSGETGYSRWRLIWGHKWIVESWDGDSKGERVDRFNFSFGSSSNWAASTGMSKKEQKVWNKYSFIQEITKRKMLIRVEKMNCYIVQSWKQILTEQKSSRVKRPAYIRVRKD